MIEKSLKGINLLIGLVIVTLLTNFVILKKMDDLQKREIDPDYMTATEVEKSLDCLAINIYREAGHEPFEGKVAVAQVTMNRVNSNKFPREVCAVVYQKSRFTERVICQFSWYCDSKHRNRPVDEEAYEESYKVAKMVFLEDFRLESLDHALYYHADYVNPNWKLKRITKIGTHIFYEG
jgi:spore germination cell wall hydrolase CwlJ-like protein